jgi:hypothetical protein
MVHIFRNHLCIGKHRHEIRVAAPARDKMEMDVLIDSRACQFSEIRAKIKTFRMGDFPERGNHFLKQLHDFKRFIAGEIGKFLQMPIWYDHNMTAVVRVQIHDDKGCLAPEDDAMVFILAVPGIAKYAAACFFFGFGK